VRDDTPPTVFPPRALNLASLELKAGDFTESLKGIVLPLFSDSRDLYFNAWWQLSLLFFFFFPSYCHFLFFSF